MLVTSVADPESPDPRDFGPPESGSGSSSQRYRMDPDPSIIKQKIIRKPLISTFVTSFWLLSFKNDVNVPSKSNTQKKIF